MKAQEMTLVISSIYIAPTLDKGTALILSGACGLVMVYLLLKERNK